jgi:nucleoside-diphosphate-sugar epimerase
MSSRPPDNGTAQANSGGKPRTCLVTGTRGYLGSRVKKALEQQGWRVVELTRAPTAGSSAIQFQLGQAVAPKDLAGAQALVHCAYDFQPLSWEALHRVNVAGSEHLFRAAREAKVERLVYISSISAFRGCRSLYGRAKLETEALARAHEAVVLRPGLIWSDSPAGMFGRLVAQVERARLLPLFGGGTQLQYLVHEEDLARQICGWAAGTLASQAEPVTLAHEKPWSFRQLLEEIARAQGKRLTFLPVPWRAVWMALKLAEGLGRPLNFRSDSLVSLMYQNPNPSFAAQEALGIRCRPFGLSH